MAADVQTEQIILRILWAGRLRACLKMCLGFRKTSQHEANHRQVDHGFAGQGLAFVVSTHSARTPEPTESTLHDPASRQHFEGVFGGDGLGAGDGGQCAFEAAQSGRASAGERAPDVRATEQRLSPPGIVSPLSPAADASGAGQWLKQSRRISKPQSVPSAAGEVSSEWAEKQRFRPAKSEFVRAPLLS